MVNVIKAKKQNVGSIFILQEWKSSSLCFGQLLSNLPFAWEREKIVKFPVKDRWAICFIYLIIFIEKLAV